MKTKFSRIQSDLRKLAQTKSSAFCLLVSSQLIYWLCELQLQDLGQKETNLIFMSNSALFCEDFSLSLI